MDDQLTWFASHKFTEWYFTQFSYYLTYLFTSIQTPFHVPPNYTFCHLRSKLLFLPWFASTCNLIMSYFLLSNLFDHKCIMLSFQYCLTWLLCLSKLLREKSDEGLSLSVRKKDMYQTTKQIWYISSFYLRNRWIFVKYFENFKLKETVCTVINLTVDI